MDDRTWETGVEELWDRVSDRLLADELNPLTRELCELELRKFRNQFFVDLSEHFDSTGKRRGFLSI
jgi:hypothetical protein